MGVYGTKLKGRPLQQSSSMSGAARSPFSKRKYRAGSGVCFATAEDRRGGVQLRLDGKFIFRCVKAEMEEPYLQSGEMRQCSGWWWGCLISIMKVWARSRGNTREKQKRSSQR